MLLIIFQGENLDILPPTAVLESLKLQHLKTLTILGTVNLFELATAMNTFHSLQSS